MALSNSILERIKKDTENKKNGTEEKSNGGATVQTQGSTSGSSGSSLSLGIRDKITRSVELKKLGYTGDPDALSSVNDEYISNFFSEWNRFAPQAQTAYNGLSWDAATSGVFDKLIGVTGSDLKDRATLIKAYLEYNKDGLAPEAYEQYSSQLTSISQFLNEISKGYSSAKDFYSQWETEDDYNKYLSDQKAYEDLVNFDVTAGQKELEELETVKNEYQGWKYLTGEEVQAKYRQFAAEYGDIKNLEAMISEKQQYLNTAKRTQEGIRLADAVNNPDFDQYSGYVSTETDDWWSNLTGNGYDQTYEYINNQNGKRDEIKHDYMIYSRDNPWSDGESSYEEKGYDYMTEDEVAVYNYYYSKEGKEAAEKYLDSIQETLNHQKATSMYENMEGKTFLEYVFGVAAGLDQFESGMKGAWQAITGEDDYIPVSATQMASGMVREDLGDVDLKWYNAKDSEWKDAKIFGSSLGQVGYDAVTTVANMAPSIMTSTVLNIIAPGSGVVAGAGMMGASAAGNAYQEMLNLGYTKDQSRAYSALVGASEAGLQYLLGGIGSLGGKLSGNVLTKMMNGVDNAFLRTAIKLGGNMFSEGLEEGLQEILTPWFQNLIMYADEDVNWSEVAYSSLLGALTAGFMEGGSTISGEVNTYKTGKQLQEAGISAQNLAEIGRTFSADSVAYQLAGRVDENTGAYTMGRLFNEIGATMTEQNIADIQSNLVSKGMTEPSAKTLAKAIAAVVENPASVTEKQAKALEANDVLAQAVIEEIVNANSTVYQRTQGYSRLVEATQQAQEGAEATGDQVNAEGQNVAQVAQTGTEGHEIATGASTIAMTEDGATGKEDLQVAEDGVTRQVSTGKEVTPKKVVSIEGGKAMIQTDSGTVAADDIEFGDKDTDLLWRHATQFNGITAAGANGIIRAYQSGLPVATYLHGAAQEFRNGYYNLPSGGEYVEKLTPAQREIIYELGQKAAGENTAKAQAKATAAKKEAANNDSSEGKVHFERNGRTFDETREVSLKTMEQLSKALGVEFYVYESYVNEAGKRVFQDANGNEVPAPNGYYDPKDGSIHIDLNAGADGKGTMLFTIAHELTHFIREWSPAKFSVLANFLVKQYAENGVSVESLVQKQIAKAKRNDRTIDYDTAYEEVVADSMEAMLTDGNVVQMMADLKAQDKSLWQKICDWFKDLVADLKAVVEAYKGIKPDSPEGKMVADMQDVIVILESLYADALVEASDNYQAAKTQKNTTQEGGVKYSFKGYAEDGKGIYESNFPKGTPKKAKGERILRYIQDVWSKKPITLRIEDALGTRYIEAQFDPTFDEGENVRTDASKLMGGNRHGTSAEQRVTLDLADDYYQLATESKYNGSKEETGKQTATHQGVKMWHYFVNDIYFAEYGSDKLAPYTVSINVKEKADGNFFYSFSAEQAEKKGEASTQRTLHAVVNSNEDAAANGNLSTGDPAKKFQATRPFAIEQDSLDENVSQPDAEVKDKKTEASPPRGSLLRASSGVPNASTNRVAQEAGNVKEKFSDREITPISNADIKKAEQFFGTTTNYNVAGYLLTDGKMLDFSGKHWGDSSSTSRQVDHRDIWDAWENGDTDGFGEMVNMIGNGNIRLMPESGGINLAVMPNSTQLSTLRGYINYFRGEVIVDVDRVGGDTIQSFEYGRGTSSSKILSDIKAYFENGTIPEKQSSIRDFLYSDRDSDGNQLSQEQQEYFKDSKVRDDQGRLLVMYHGTPNGGFTKFRSGTYFTQNPGYADVYQNPGASSISTKKDAAAPMTYKVYLDIKKPFDTRNATERKIFMEEFYRQHGTGTPLADSGLPDWVDGMDLQEFIEEMEYDYDGLILDEGGVGGYGEEVVSRGLSYVVFSPEQVKNADNKAPTSDPDIRFSERDPELEKVNRVLTKENTELKYDIAYLKELLKLQKQATGGTKFTKTSVEAAAGQLMKYAGAKGEKAELAALLNDVYGYIAKGEELTWEGVKEAAQPAVEWLKDHVRTEKKIDSYAQDILRNIRASRIYLDEQQKKEVAYQYGSYNEFRKKAMGSVVIAEKDSISLDSQWHEWASMYPNIFDAETTANDMPGALLDAVDTLRNMNDMDSYGYDDELFSQDLLRQVYDSYWNVSTLYTVTDKAQKEINKLKYEHSTRMAALRKFHSEKTAKLKQEHKEALQQVRREYRERSEKKQREITERYQESRKRNAESRKKTEMRRKIRRTIMDLDKLLNRGNKKLNVKEGMRDLVAEALKSADILFTDEYGSEDMVRDGVGTELTEHEAKYMAEARTILEQMASDDAEDNLQSKLDYRLGKLKDVFARERTRLNKTKVSEVLGSLADAYASLENSEQSYVSGAFDENVYQYLTMLKAEVGGTIVKDMSLGQLENLHKAYTMVLATVRNANKMFAGNMKQTREQLGSQTIAEVQKAGGEHGLWLPGEDKVNAFSWNNQKPVYAFERIGSDTLKKLFENTRAGEDGWAQDMTEARTYYLEQSRKHKFDGWDFGKQYKFTSTSGIDFSLNLEQIMSLYAYSKREQAHDHLMKGGFVFDSNTQVQVNKAGIKVNYLQRNAKAHNVSPEILGEITSKLTAEQRAFVDEMQDYLSTTMGGKGNEVSMQMYGVELFKEKNYFPLRSAGQYMERAKEANLKKEQGQISIVNSGFTKATTPKSSNPVVLSGFMDVWAEHVNEMSMYHSFVLPMEDFRRVYNYSSPNMETGQSISVNSVIQDAYGKEATDYIDQLYRDLNGGAVSDPRETPAKALMGKFKKAAVFASLSVVIQQPSAIGRAFAIVDPKYFIGSKVDSKRHKALWAELKQYAPVATIKEMGYFDTGMGKSAQDFIKGKEYNTIKEKAAAIFTDESYRDELLSKGPALADELTWCAIWEAVKRETKAKNPGMKVTSEEFLTAAGKRFTEVITKTQVYDSVLSRSANMRSKGAFMSMWTAFMAEPTTTINMVEDALRKGKAGNKKYAARAMGAVLSSVILNSLLVSLVYAMRDDDDDETFLEKYVQSFATEILDGINPLTYYPFLKDIWSALQGFDIERSDMSLITSVAEALTKLVQVYSKDTDGMDEEALDAYNKSLADAWWKVADYVTALAGIPVKNVRRDINGAVNMYKTIAADLTDRDTTWGSLVDKTWDDVKNSIPVVGWLPDETAADKLYKATVSGDTAYQKRLSSAYASQTALDNAIRKGLRANDSRIWEAAIAWNDNDLETYKRIAKEIIGEGYFSQDNVVMAIQAEAKAMIETQSSSTESKAKGLFTAEKFAVAISQGNSTMAAYIKADIIETAQKNGKTAEEAERSFASSAKTNLEELFAEGSITQNQAINALATYCGYDQDKATETVTKWRAEKETGIAFDDIKDAFVAGNISEENARNMYITYGGYTEEEAAQKVTVMAFVKENPECDGISYAAVENYQTYCEASGVPAKTYYDVWKYNSSASADVDASGKTISGSKKAKVLAYIHGLDLTYAQKDSIYYAFGWAASTIDEAPWH